MSHDPTPYNTAPALTEARLGQDCGTWLNKYHRHAYAHFFHIPNGGLRTVREASALKSQHVKAGVSDYLLALPRGTCHGLWMEFKTPTGQLRPEQVQWLQRMAAAGYATAVIRTLESFQLLLTEYLTGT